MVPCQAELFTSDGHGRAKASIFEEGNRGRRAHRDRLIGARPMPCLPDGFQLCRTICQALPRPDAMISYRGFGGRPGQPCRAAPCPIRDINTTDPPDLCSLSLSFPPSLRVFRPSLPLCSPASSLSLFSSHASSRSSGAVLAGNARRIGLVSLR